MRKLVIIFILIFVGVDKTYSTCQPKVDERFELTSIMFALAGVPEYCQCAIPSYKQDIIDDLGPYDQTEAIDYIRELNQVHGIGYNAVSTTADMLEIKDGEIRLQSQYDIAKIAEADPRWNEALFSKYLKIANDFYRQSNFHQFYMDHHELYRAAEQRMTELLAEIEMGWFTSFFGKPLDSSLKVYICLNNGPSNYSFPNGVLIGMMADAEGMPSVNETIEFMLLHEFGHHFANPLFDTHKKTLESSAENMFPYVRELMYQSAYGNAKTMVIEWLTNLLVLMYYRDNNPIFLGHLTASNTSKGFIWMGRSIRFMENFYENRDKYPYFKNFMPQVNEFMKFTSDHYDEVITEYEHRHPYVVGVYPLTGTNIKDCTEIRVIFSEPMDMDVYGMDSRSLSSKGISPLPIYDAKYINDRTHVLYIRTEELAENKSYGCILPGYAYQSEHCFPMDHDQELLFNTFEK